MYFHTGCLNKKWDLVNDVSFFCRLYWGSRVRSRDTKKPKLACKGMSRYYWNFLSVPSVHPRPPICPTLDANIIDQIPLLIETPCTFFKLNKPPRFVEWISSISSCEVPSSTAQI